MRYFFSPQETLEVTSNIVAAASSSSSSSSTAAANTTTMSPSGPTDSATTVGVVAGDSATTVGVVATEKKREKKTVRLNVPY